MTLVRRWSIPSSFLVYGCWLSHAVVRLIALSLSLMRGGRCRSGAGDPAIDAIYKRVCCTLCVVARGPLVGFGNCWCGERPKAERRRQSGDQRVSQVRHERLIARELTHVGKDSSAAQLIGSAVRFPFARGASSIPPHSCPLQSFRCTLFTALSSAALRYTPICTRFYAQA